MEEQNSAVLENFISKIEQWIESNGIIYGTKYDTEETTKILSMSKNQFGNLSRDDCIKYIFILNQYLMHLNTILSKEKAIKNWSEQFLSFLINDHNKDDYSVGKDRKTYLAIKNNKLCSSLNSIKVHSESRILYTENQIPYIENVAKILERKLYER